MAKKDMKNWIIGGLIVVIAIFGFISFFPKEGSPATTNKIADIPATDEQGVCVAREGVKVGMCCTKLDSNGNLIPVDCEDLIYQPLPAQAFFQLGQGSKLVNLPAVYFMVRAENAGNFATRIRVGSVTVTAIEGGDSEGIARIKAGFETLKGIGWKLAPTGATVDFGMAQEDSIIIDIPNTYQMTDGVYQVVIKMEAEDPSGVPTATGQTTILLDIEQELIAFNVDVEQTV
jgi:hypothetical protein